MKSARTPKAAADRGAAAVEFALILLPLILLIGGIIDFGIVVIGPAAINIVDMFGSM